MKEYEFLYPDREIEVLQGLRASKANKDCRDLLARGDQMDLKAQKGIQEHQAFPVILESKDPKG